MSWGASLQAQEQGDREDVEITSIAEFWDTEIAAKDRGVPYRYEFDVLYYDPIWKVLHVSDGDMVEYIATDAPLRIESGQRILVTGKTKPPGSEFWITDSKIEVIGISEYKAQPMNLAEIDHRGMLNEAVEIRGLVSSQSFDGEAHMRLDLSSEGYHLMVWIPVDPNQPVPQWAGSVVRVKGVYGPKFEPSGELRSIEIFCPSVDAVVYESHLSEVKEFDLPRTRVEELNEVPQDQRVRVVGEVVGGILGQSLFLRDESGQVSVAVSQLGAWENGETVEVVGYPEVVGISRNLMRAWVRPVDREMALEFGAMPNRLLHRVTASVMELTPSEAANADQVQLEGVVTWSSPNSMVFFVQDATGGIRVRRPDAVSAPPLPGALVKVEGRTIVGDFAPEIEASVVRQWGEVGVPAAKAITFEQAMTGVEEAQWVEVTGYVYGVRRESGWGKVELSTISGPLSARLPRDTDVRDLVGTVVTLRGVASAVADEKRKLVGVEVWVPGRDDIEVDADAVRNVFDLPLSRLDEVGLFSVSANLHRRIKIAGTVLHWSPRGRFIVQDGASVLMVLTREESPLRRGDFVEIAGFYGREGGRAVLREGQFRKLGTGDLLAPIKIDLSEGVAPEHEGHLVIVEGEIIEGFHLGAETRAAVRSGRTIFEVRLEDNWQGSRMSLPLEGSVVQVQGVYMVDYDDQSEPAGFHLLAGESDQFVVLQAPQWWTPRRVLLGALLLVGGIAGALFWVRMLHVRVALQTRQIEEQMQRSTQLEADLNRAARLESLGTLASGIAQDFSTLLTAVHERISTVSAEPRLPTQVKAQLDEARGASLRARDLAHQLSAFSESVVPHPTSVDVAKVIGDVVTHFDLPHTIAPRWRLAEQLPIIETDAGMLRQVVQNLLFNAAQAMPKGGELGVSIGTEKFVDESDSLLQPGDYLRIQIRDSGEGIAEKNLGRAFDPYFTTRPGAQGLGLAVVYSLIRRLRGKVIIESTPMVGTTVTFWLPSAGKADSR